MTSCQPGAGSGLACSVLFSGSRSKRTGPDLKAPEPWKTKKIERSKHLPEVTRWRISGTSKNHVTVLVRPLVNLVTSSDVLVATSDALAVSSSDALAVSSNALAKLLVMPMFGSSPRYFRHGTWTLRP